MITKTSGWQNTEIKEKKNRLTSGMRAVMNWATLEEHDSVLDLFCRDGALLSALCEKLRLNVCGICQDVQYSRELRERLYNSDIVFAEPDDIPWRDGAFDAVLAGELIKKENAERVLCETNRVLKPGGQAVILTKIFCGKKDIYPEKKELMRLMESTGFDHVSWRLSGIWGVAVGWKTGE